jgi:hypothetical protein
LKVESFDWKKTHTKGIDVIYLFGIKVASLFYKLSPSLDYLYSNEVFAIGKLSINMVFQEFIYAMNLVFKNQMHWPYGEDLSKVIVDFKSNVGFF